MANVDNHAHARRRADRLHSRPTGLNRAAADTTMTTAARATKERPDESPDIAPDAQARQSDHSQAEISDQDLIARRAYERFQLRGGEHGRDQDDWLEAECELNKAVDE